MYKQRLNAQQRRFVDEYLIDFNTTAAAARAGYSMKNTSVGNRLMRKPYIADEVTKRCLAIQVKLEVNADDVRRGLARIATDPREEKDGGPAWRDRILAWRELAKLFGMYTHKIQITGTVTLVDLLLAADRKVAELPTPEVRH